MFISQKTVERLRFIDYLSIAEDPIQSNYGEVVEKFLRLNPYACSSYLRNRFNP